MFFLSDLSHCEVVTEWANGCSWAEALEISGASPGDLSRILTRVLDALRQLGNLPYTPIRKSDLSSSLSDLPRGIHPEIRRLCRDAAQLINRYPVKDPLSFEAEEDEFEVDDDDDDIAADPSVPIEETTEIVP